VCHFVRTGVYWAMMGHGCGEGPDEALAARARDGCEGCFTRLYERYRHAVARYVFEAYVRTFDVALDIEDEVWKKVVEHIGGWTGERSFRAWLFAIARNHALNVLRHERRAPEAAPASEVAGPLEVLTSAESRAAAVRLVRALPEELREVFVLRVVFDLAPAALAEMFDVPVSTIRGRLFRARKLLTEGVRHDVR
jgi:RNA polymerase sigma factor (sigma-70 family)